MKLFAVLLFLAASLTIQAQEVVFNGATYKVKGKTILENNVDITSRLSVEEKIEILETLKEQKVLEAERVKADKNAKKAEKAFKKKEKAQSNFDKASSKYNRAVAKYESLKKRGRLSPVKEMKWVEKVEKLKYKRDKFEGKLNKCKINLK
ncbi:hypothetical protein [Flavivirga eckloniae]|uniref:DUF4398 domain-containing protein n=1 Tax=Flavivirga eckloniae TaxID=1803846 RepID=A0A2K9PS55_9FLAO|nr:hypothetical protein [Flavivirga eckloniae]AUP79896.1 hypothetical protein C1H87_14770 [Flavivirga eckloniae]